MITIDGKWLPEGLNRNDRNCIKSVPELVDYINEIGFLPLFKSNVEGFSVEQITARDSWWCGNPEDDPWEWREEISSKGYAVYGKLFSGKAGYISKDWYPYFAACRRDCYDFDSRYEDGLVSRRQKLIVDVLNEYGSLPSYELKALAGFGREGEKGFEGTISALQMQTYIAVSGFHRKHNKKNEEYGWSVADYSLSENLLGEEHVRSAYAIGTRKAKEKIIDRLLKKFPKTSYQEAEKLID